MLLQCCIQNGNNAFKNWAVTLFSKRRTRVCTIRKSPSLAPRNYVRRNTIVEQRTLEEECAILPQPWNSEPEDKLFSLAYLRVVTGVSWSILHVFCRFGKSLWLCASAFVVWEVLQSTGYLSNCFVQSGLSVCTNRNSLRWVSDSVRGILLAPSEEDFKHALKYFTIEGEMAGRKIRTFKFEWDASFKWWERLCFWWRGCNILGFYSWVMEKCQMDQGKC